jgi:hypothetical protein
MKSSSRLGVLGAAFVVMGILGGAALAGCSGDDDDAKDSGPIDGTWRVDTVLCSGTAQGAGPITTLDVDDDGGTFTLEIPATCTSTIAESYAYPSDSSIEITPTANTCTPSNDACAPLFGGLTTCPVPPPVTFEYDRTGDALVFTRTSVGPPVDPCPEGQEVRFEMSAL